MNPLSIGVASLIVWLVLCRTLIRGWRCRRALSRTTGYQVTIVSSMAIEPKGTLRVRAIPLADSLLDRGHSVNIITIPADTPHYSGEATKVGNVTVNNLECYGPFALGSVPFLLWSVVQSAPDVVYLFKPVGAASIAVILLQLFLGMIVVVDADDIEGSRGWAREASLSRPLLWAADSLEFYWFMFADAVTVANRQIASYAKVHARRRENVFLYPNCPVLQRLPRSPTDVFTVVYLGYNALDEMLLLAEVADRLSSDGFLIRYVIAGAGEGMQQLERRFEAISPPIDYLFPGYADAEMAATLLSEADVGVYFAAKSRANDAKCPAKLVEYLNAGLAVVASNVRGSRQYIRHAETGYLVEPNNASEIVEVIKNLYSRPDLRASLGSNAIRFVDEYFSWDMAARVAEQALLAAFGVKEAYRPWEYAPPMSLADDLPPSIDVVSPVESEEK